MWNGWKGREGEIHRKGGESLSLQERCGLNEQRGRMCRQMKDEETDEDRRQGALLRGRKKAQGLGVEVAEAGRGD